MPAYKAGVPSFSVLSFRLPVRQGEIIHLNLSTSDDAFPTSWMEVLAEEILRSDKQSQGHGKERDLIGDNR